MLLHVVFCLIIIFYKRLQFYDSTKFLIDFTENSHEHMDERPLLREAENLVNIVKSALETKQRKIKSVIESADQLQENMKVQYTSGLQQIQMIRGQHVSIDDRLYLSALLHAYVLCFSTSLR